MKAGRRAGAVSRHHPFRPVLAAVTTLALAAGLSAAPVFAAPTTPGTKNAATENDDPPPDPPAFEERGKGKPHRLSFAVEVASGRADTVSGGDALVRVEVPRNVPPHHVRISVDGRDLTDRFEPTEDGRTLLGQIDGLAVGDDELTVRSNGRGRGRPSESLTLTNHPAEGPVFSGLHIPLYCTADGPPWNLGPVDENCHLDEPDVTYQYRTTAGEWAALPDGPVPENVATTTTTTGETVPYTVRIERGTINRAVYETAILHEPGTPVPDPWTSTSGWNERLVYTFGGACGIGHTQAAGTGGVLNDTLLSRGYGVASSTFNVYANNCNDVTSAETAMMVKEHFAETYGAPQFTMGWEVRPGRCNSC